MDDVRPDQADTRDFNVNADEVTCRQFVELITEYLEGTLTGRTLSHVEEHLVMCDWCITYLEQMDATIHALSRLDDSPTPEPSEAVLIALRARRDDK